MSPTIFITGVTGYIGGEVAVVLASKHPEYDLVFLVRNGEQSKVVKARFPDSDTVIGDLDSHSVLVEQGKLADVVLHHVQVGQSIIEGMSLGKKGYYVHVSGSGILHDVTNGYGNPTSKIYNDVADLDEITSFDSSHVHADIDGSVSAAGLKYGIQTAILSPVTIYGIGRGPAKTRSLQIPFLVEGILKRRKAFTVLEGNNIWDNIHIADLAEAYNVLVEEALKPNGGASTWGKQGYYFVQAAEHTWKDVTTDIAMTAYKVGALDTAEIDKLSVEDASTVHPWAPLLWGGNCRCRGTRIRALGWRPVGPTLRECLAEMVEFEVKALGTQSSLTTF
ncbi:NAD(P)-binding protein [Tothia fuscella]|uniref:NAD(P)-binding protein n=1 Tax=Tothia fuscella TaxID=1048955 RepID=A0A9P4NT90_9PEZI|nr:NAD(P)-binding protein [Tothia fuscella]